MEHYLLVRQFGHIFDEIHKEILEICAVDYKQPKEFIRFFEGNDG